MELQYVSIIRSAKVSILLRSSLYRVRHPHVVSSTFIEYKFQRISVCNRCRICMTLELKWNARRIPTNLSTPGTSPHSSPCVASDSLWKPPSPKDLTVLSFYTPPRSTWSHHLCSKTNSVQHVQLRSPWPWASNQSGMPSLESSYDMKMQKCLRTEGIDRCEFNQHKGWSSKHAHLSPVFGCATHSNSWIRRDTRISLDLYKQGNSRYRCLFSSPFQTFVIPADYPKWHWMRLSDVGCG